MKREQPAPSLDTQPADPLQDPLRDPLHEWLGQILVLDTQDPLLYIGTLERFSEAFLVLTEADVHDSNDSRATKDLYLSEAADLGVRVNRARVIVARHQVASISCLADVRT